MTRYSVLDFSVKPSIQGTEYIYLAVPGGNFRVSVNTLASYIGGGGGSVSWGGIGGTLSNQTDLQTALNLKATLASPTFTGTVSGITKAMVGLSNVDNTSDAGKPVSTAQQTALNLKANIASPTFTGTVSGITAAMVGLGNVDNTSDASKPVSTATQTALNGKLATTITTTGDLIYSSSGATPARLPIGGTNQVLTVIGGLPSWQTASSGFANPMTTAGDIITGGASGTPGRLGIGGNGSFLGVVGGAITWTTPSGSGDVVGPASSVSGRVATFNGTTGKLIQDGGTLLSALAPLASPTFTGTVTIPSGASIAGFAPLASPALTGTPTAPTATAATNNTQVATTAYADASSVGARLPAVQAVTSAATVTPTFSNDLVKITAQAAGLTLANPSGTAVDGWGIVIRIKDNGTARAISYGTQYRAIGVTLPTTTVISKTLYLAGIWNSDDTKFDILAVGQEA